MKLPKYCTICRAHTGSHQSIVLRHQRALRLTNRDQESSFEDLLGYDNSVSIHQKNLHTLMVEILKAKDCLNPPFIKEVFCPQTNQYNLRNYRDFDKSRMRSVMCGSESV